MNVMRTVADAKAVMDDAWRRRERRRTDKIAAGNRSERADREYDQAVIDHSRAAAEYVRACERAGISPAKGVSRQPTTGTACRRLEAARRVGAGYLA